MSSPKSINLALQGGGTHGAFAWGVLDRLLEDERIAIDGISATSAGAMNAAVLAYGWGSAAAMAPARRSPRSGSASATPARSRCCSRPGSIG
jgi:predicted acylesterase/phospholipase RssA